MSSSKLLHLLHCLLFSLLIFFLFFDSAFAAGPKTSSKAVQSSKAAQSSKPAPPKRKNVKKQPFVAVLAGGPQGDEGDMSEVLGKRISATLKRLGYRTAIINPINPLQAVKQLENLKKKERKNLVAFNACQGEFGGSGLVQALLEWLRIPHTHSGLAATLLASNKIHTKAVVEKAGVNVAPSVVFNTKEGDLASLCKHPVVTGGATILKPITEANSTGIHFFARGECPSAEFVANWKYGNAFMMERYIPGREFTCAVLNNKVLGILEFEWGNEESIKKRKGVVKEDEEDRFDKWGKYKTNTHIEDKELEQELHRLVLLAHRAVGCNGVSRSEFRVKRVCSAESACRNEIYFLEINTQPGMNDHSPLPEIAQKHAGMSYGDLTEYMVLHPRKFD